jgi:hypothetical protein
MPAERTIPPITRTIAPTNQMSALLSVYRMTIHSTLQRIIQLPVDRHCMKIRLGSGLAHTHLTAKWTPIAFDQWGP